ncbi:BQ2448_316 [Microbotryum intermedium]|uniref:BQ2448_316 protein n=1 Tax=Microbotryum intermedium TaxID=269621 RepID=A0A238F572_9BASI|nr:BQ2448_316 [Microbotryum intermedium]
MSGSSDPPRNDDSDPVGFNFSSSAALRYGSPRHDDMVQCQLQAHQAQQHLHADSYSGPSQSRGAQNGHGYDASTIIDHSYPPYPSSGLSAAASPLGLAPTTQAGLDRSLASTSRLPASISTYYQAVGSEYHDSYSEVTPVPYNLLPYQAHGLPHFNSDPSSADVYPYQHDQIQPHQPVEHSYDDPHAQATVNNNHHGPDWCSFQSQQQEHHHLPNRRLQPQQRRQQRPGAMQSHCLSSPRTTVGSAQFEAPLHTVTTDIGSCSPYQYPNYPALAGSASRSSSTGRDSNHSSQYPSYSASTEWAPRATHPSDSAQFQPPPHLQHTGQYYSPHEIHASSVASTGHEYHPLSAIDQSYIGHPDAALHPNVASHPPAPVPLEAAYDPMNPPAHPSASLQRAAPTPFHCASPVVDPAAGLDTSDSSWHGQPTETSNPSIYSSSHTFTFAHNGPPTNASGPQTSNSGSYASRLYSTPPMTPDSGPGSTGSATTSEAARSPSTVVLVAAAERKKIREERAAAEVASKNVASSPGDVLPSLIPGIKAITVKKSAQAGSARPCLELPVSCQMCSTPIGKLSLRGTSIDKGNDRIIAKGVYFCLACVPVLRRVKPSLATREPEATYADTLSAAVDRLESLTLGLSPTLGSSPTGTQPGNPPGSQPSAQHRSSPSSAPTSASKKRVKGEENLLACDICRRDIGSGELTCALRDAPPGSKVEYTPEVACASCSEKYRRCSDCGGGGGAKGVGRWRARELFPGGRRTCQLSHARQGSLSEMSYDVWPITSLPPEQLPDLIAMCREIYMLHVLGTLAVLDMMESVAPLASTFEQVLLLATDAWPMFERAMREDIEPTTSTRRYLALRWIAMRKPQPKRDGSRSANTPSLTANGRTLAGFVLAEQDLLLGSCYITVTMPTGTGEGYDATSRLMHSLFRHIQNDIASINAMRARQSEPLLPLLKHAWTLHFEKRESRVMNRPDAKRGFLSLEECEACPVAAHQLSSRSALLTRRLVYASTDLATYPDADEKYFTPHRPVWLSVDLLKYWNCYVKRITDNDDWLVTNTRRVISSSGDGG